MKVSLKKKQYEIVPFLKKAYNVVSKIKYKGVNLWYPLASPLYHFYEEKTEIKNYAPSPSWKRIFAFLLLKEDIRLKNPQGSILVSLFLDSSDRHLDLFNNYLKSFSKKELVILTKKGFKFSFPNVLNIFKLLKTLNKLGFRNCFETKKDFYYFFAFIYLYTRQVGVLNKIINKINPSAYISFNAAVDRNESIITQLMNNSKVTTFNIQHGLLEPWDRFSLDSLIHDVTISDYFLVWGKKSKNTLSRYIPDRKIITVGNPRYPKITIGNLAPLKNGVFFLSGKLFRESNREIFKILEKFAIKNSDVKIKVKPHPGESLDNYSFNSGLLSPLKSTEDATEILKKSDFIITHNTTVSMEALSYQIPIFQFKDKFFRREAIIKKINFWDFDSFYNSFFKYVKHKNRLNLNKYYKGLYKYNFFHPKEGSISSHFRDIVLKSKKKNSI